MMSADVQYDPQYPLQIGVDFGLTPAAIFGQRTSGGAWKILDELVTFDMGLERFGQELIGKIAASFNKAEVQIWGDPAGNKREEIYEVTAFVHLQSIGFLAQPTDSTLLMKTQSVTVGLAFTLYMPPPNRWVWLKG